MILAIENSKKKIKKIKEKYNDVIIVKSYKDAKLNNIYDLIIMGNEWESFFKKEKFKFCELLKSYFKNTPIVITAKSNNKYFFSYLVHHEFVNTRVIPFYLFMHENFRYNNL